MSLLQLTEQNMDSIELFLPCSSLGCMSELGDRGHNEAHLVLKDYRCPSELYSLASVDGRTFIIG